MSKKNDKFAFRVEGVDYTTNDDRMKGSDVRSESGHNPVANYSLIEVKERYTTSVGLQDPVILVEGEKPVFRIFEADGNFDFTVEDLGWEWGEATIPEAFVREVAEIADDREIIVAVVGNPEIHVPRGGVINLSGKGVERIYSKKVAAPAKIELTFVINGDPLAIKAKPNDVLLDLLKEALEKSENTGQPLDAWQITDEPGAPLDPEKTVAELGLKDGAVLVVSLKTGAAG